MSNGSISHETEGSWSSSVIICEAAQLVSSAAFTDNRLSTGHFVSYIFVDYNTWPGVGGWRGLKAAVHRTECTLTSTIGLFYYILQISYMYEIYINEAISV